MTDLAGTIAVVNEGFRSGEGAWCGASPTPEAPAALLRVGGAAPIIRRGQSAPQVGDGTVRQWSRGRHAPMIVVYHDLSTARSPLTDQINVTTDPDIFRRHVQYFARNFDLIGPDDLTSDPLPKRPLLITFDDVYKSVLEVGGPILREFNAQSIWFINPESVAAETLPLDNLLSLAVVQLGGVAVAGLLGVPRWTGASAADLISAHLPTLSYAHIQELKTQVCKRLGQTESDLRRQSNMFIETADLQRLRHYRIGAGNHSLTHTFFRALSPAELDTEIRVSREMLEHLTGQSVTYLAIPYGHEADATAAALDTARSSGHTAIFLVHGRSNYSMPANDVYYRVAPGNVRPELLPVSIHILPRLRTLRDRFH